MSMLDPFVQKLNERNLCSWFILPLLDLNVEKFGASNFINAYQVKNTTLSIEEGEPVAAIAVLVLDVHLCIKVIESPLYQQFISSQHGDYLIFDIPEEWWMDYDTFLRGRYSKLSEEAKHKIREQSGLKFEFADEKGNKVTDALLMALDKHPVLKEKWMEVLKVREEHLPDEFLSPPGEHSFLSLENL